MKLVDYGGLYNTDDIIPMGEFSKLGKLRIEMSVILVAVFMIIFCTVPESFHQYGKIHADAKYNHDSQFYETAIHVLSGTVEHILADGVKPHYFLFVSCAVLNYDAFIMAQQMSFASPPLENKTSSNPRRELARVVSQNLLSAVPPAYKSVFRNGVFEVEASKRISLSELHSRLETAIIQRRADVEHRMKNVQLPVEGF